MARQTLNDSDREQWVDNDEGLYTFWRTERPRLSKRAFVRANRAAIDAVIRNVTEAAGQRTISVTAEIWRTSFESRETKMLNSDMDAELQEAIRELGSNFEVDRCRHATCAETTIWVFARIAEIKRRTRPKGTLVTHGAQVATITRRPPGEVWAGAWRVHMMSGGVPTAQHFTNGLASACAYVKERGLKAA